MLKQRLPEQFDIRAVLASTERYMIPVLIVLIALVSAYRFLPWDSWLAEDTTTASQYADDSGKHLDSNAGDLSVDTETASTIDLQAGKVTEAQRSEALTQKINPISDADTPTLMGDIIGGASPETEIERAIERWRHNWQTKDVYNYFDAYRPGYSDPALQLSHNDWLEHRYQAIIRAKDLVVTISALRIELHSHDRATARFTLRYRSEDANTTTTKKLEFERMGRWWKIVRETSG